MVLVIIGNGSTAQSVLSLNTKGTFFSVNIGWSVGMFLGVLVSGGVSGGHLNPAVTLALAMVGRISWRRTPHYILAQYLGALLGGALVFFLYWDALVWYEHHHGSYRSVSSVEHSVYLVVSDLFLTLQSYSQVFHLLTSVTGVALVTRY